MTVSPPRVLVVDDDSEICDVYDQILRDQGYQVAIARSRAEAIEILQRPNTDFEVLILDIALPDSDGAEVARDITDRLGQRPTLYVSGWTDEFWNLAEAPGRWLVMQKPIPVPRLLEAVDWLAGRRAARPD